VSHRIEVDKRSCQSSGNCVSAEPAMFGFDDDSLAEVRVGAADLPIDALLSVARRCPALAITILDEDGEALDVGY
jgi:ferredoxin